MEYACSQTTSLAPSFQLVPRPSVNRLYATFDIPYLIAGETLREGGTRLKAFQIRRYDYIVILLFIHYLGICILSIYITSARARADHRGHT